MWMSHWKSPPQSDATTSGSAKEDVFLLPGALLAGQLALDRTECQANACIDQNDSIVCFAVLFV